MQRYMGYLERLLLSLWVGAMWAVGYIVIPQLFRSLDERSQAGTIAGELLSQVSYLGFAVSLILLFLVYLQERAALMKSWRIWLLAVITLLALLNEFYLHPEIAMMRDSEEVALDDRSRFALFHGISSLIYLVGSIAGAVLVAVGVTRNSDRN